MFEYCRLIESVPRVELYAPNGVHKEFPKSREKDALTEILNGLGAKGWEAIGLSSDNARVTVIMKRKKDGVSE